MLPRRNLSAHYVRNPCLVMTKRSWFRWMTLGQAFFQLSWLINWHWIRESWCTWDREDVGWCAICCRKIITKWQSSIDAASIIWCWNFTVMKHKSVLVLYVSDVIYSTGCLKRKPMARATNMTEYEEHLKEWLRGAKDREGGRRQRSMSNQSSNPQEPNSPELFDQSS